MVAKECSWKQLTDVVLWLEYMESPLIVYVTLLAEFMGTKWNIYIHRTEQNWTELIFIGRTLAQYITTKVFNIIQRIGWTHHEGWTAITGTLVRWVDWILYGNQWKAKGSSNRKPHRIGGISSCQNDNTMCHQRRGSCQSDDPLPSVINNVFKLDSWKRMNASIQT